MPPASLSFGQRLQLYVDQGVRSLDFSRAPLAAGDMEMLTAKASEGRHRWGKKWR